MATRGGATKRCGACGVELKEAPDACPLCGADPAAPAERKETHPWSVEAYQARLRRLRKQLDELRGEEAV